MRSRTALLSSDLSLISPPLLTGMNAAVRAVVRVGIFTGARVFFVHEVGSYFVLCHFSVLCLICLPPSSHFLFLTSLLQCRFLFLGSVSLSHSFPLLIFAN